MVADFSPLVSCGWLNSHLYKQELIILDIRTFEEYQSHIH
jgi:hypothetical protein